MKMNDGEAATIADAFKSKNFTPFMTGGVYLCGIKYQFLRTEDDKLVLAKKKDCGAVTLQASKTGEFYFHLSLHLERVSFISDSLCRCARA